MKKPKITVLMCVFNEKLIQLEHAIYSILNQTYSNFEFLIILDNPNNIELYRFLKKVENKDKRIVLYINDENLGLPLSLNKGLLLAKGDYIARMDADDISYRDRLRLQSAILDKEENISIVGGNYVYIDENDKFIKTNIRIKDDKNVEKMMRYGNVIAHPSVMFRKNDIIAIGGYRNIKYAEDYDLWLRAILNNKRIKIIDKTILKYRIRKNSISNQNVFRQRLTANLLRKNFKKRSELDLSDLNKYLEKQDKESAKKKYELSRKLYSISLEKKKENFLICYILMFISFIICFDTFLFFCETKMLIFYSK